jgi:hypothetical protein
VPPRLNARLLLQGERRTSTIVSTGVLCSRPPGSTAQDWGAFNEAFAEAEYESSADIEARFTAPAKLSDYHAVV